MFTPLAFGLQDVILLVVAVGGLGAFGIGAVLLFLFFRSSRSGTRGASQPVVYGNLVQCPNCGYMNPLETAACLNCRHPLSHMRGQPVPAAPAAPAAVPGYVPPQPQVPPPVQPTAGQQYAPAPAPVPAPAPGPVQAAPVPPPAPVAHQVPAEPPPPAPAGMPRAWLEGAGGAIMGHQAVLTQADTLVGRSTTCDVQIYDPKVSRRHFVIRYANGAFFLQDQQSSRGTRINGQPVMAQKLDDGDHIELGDSSLIFHVE
ncbi:MAG: FHA domain-containing protein [Chloroflexi bacterium]|nr:FHA domain-containing protein [Chloroflexota bacterium]